MASEEFAYDCYAVELVRVDLQDLTLEPLHRDNQLSAALSQHIPYLDDLIVLIGELRLKTSGDLKQGFQNLKMSLRKNRAQWSNLESKSEN